MEEPLFVTALKERIKTLESQAEKWHHLVRDLSDGMQALEKRMLEQIAALTEERDHYAQERDALTQQVKEKAMLDQWM